MSTTKISASILALTALVWTAGCQKQELPGAEKLGVNGVAYTPVTEPITNKVIDASVLDAGTGSTFSFDTHQAWFNFHTVSATPTTNKGTGSKREDWNLAFWNGSGLNRIILNYSVTTQAKLITSATTLTAAIGQVTQLEAANTLFNGGTFGFGDLSTFDFHKDGQFVIGTPSTAYRVYLIKTPPVQVHPDTTGSAPVNVTHWLVRVRWNNTSSPQGYYVQYQGVNRVNATTWNWVGTATEISNIPKVATRQYQFVKFGAGTGSPAIQPALSLWNLGLSAVTLKRYVNPSAGGGAYPFALKGVVLNNNPAVQVYSVRHANTAGTNAGGPGPYDPNYTWNNDPARDPANSVESQFLAFNASNINDLNFSSTNQEEIGQYWRYLDMGNYQIFVDRFFVIKLANGDVYKVKFENLTAGTTSNPVNNGIRIRYSRIATP